MSHWVKTITETPAKTQLLIQLNSKLAKLSRSGNHQDALHLFDEIHSSYYPSINPDHYTLSSALKACAYLRNAPFGNQLHAYAIRAGLKSYSHVGNTLLLLYAKASDLSLVKRVFQDIENPDVYSLTILLSACIKLREFAFAFDVFDKLPHRGLAVWNAVITGCVENGREEFGFGLFREMHVLGVRHDNYSFASVLSACKVDFGKQVHSLVMKTGFLVKPSVVNALITMYFNSGKILDAYVMFEEAESVHDQITYNVMIDGLVSIGKLETAFEIFRIMLKLGFKPTELTFMTLMSSCSFLDIGYQIHNKAIKFGFENFSSVSSATMIMYSSFGDITAIQRIFESIKDKDIISWNTIISCYGQLKFGELATLAYVEMQRAGLLPDEFTLGSLLASSEVLEHVEIFHALAFTNGLKLDCHISNALVCGYSKYGKVEEAYQIFNDMYPKNMISWNSIISGFLLNGFPVQGLEQFSNLLRSRLNPNAYTLSMALTICASIQSSRHGEQIHSYILTHNLFEKSLGNALITMYSKGGILDLSLRVFNQMTDKDTITWNSMISAYAQHGKGKEAVWCFEAMKENGINPDETTFTIVLSACSHAGLVNDGTRVFNSMVCNYGFTPREDHFSCMIDLLGRAGYLDEAEKVISSKNIDPGVWWTLFSACAAHGNVRLGRVIAELILENGKDPSVYVVLSNMYATAGQWEEAAKMRELLNETGTLKQPGYSWVGL
ncbi:hypothetical protein ACFE04_024200 [Oxalis oulophora]